MTAIATPLGSSVRSALDRTSGHLRALQHPAGWWKGELETNVTIEAEDLFLRHYLGLLDEQQVAATARWIRSKQRDDGSWATFYGGPADLSTTAEAYVALRLAGDPADAQHMRLAAELIRDQGGLEASRVFTRMWLSLLGLWSWARVPVLPPEQMLLPARAPLSIYSFGCWARQTIVPLQIATTLRPVEPVAFSVDELRSGVEPAAPPLDAWGRAFTLIDRGLRLYARRPLRAVRRRALDTGAQWILDRQEADGSWGGIQPPWVWSIVALHALGYPLEHPALVKGLAGLDSFTIEDELGRRIEACQSPVWDTALALIGLLDAGVPPNDDSIARGAQWLAEREVRVRGDWSVRRPKLEPGGFPFEFANDNYPDIDDTAEIVIALRRAGAGAAAIDRGVSWMLGMQSSNGGWGAFDADNTSRLPSKLPFCDFGEVTDPPSADVTAHVLEALALEGLAESPAAQRGIEYLLREQEADGSWFGRWGANHLYGTGAAVPALVACGLGGHESIRRAVDWLGAVQNEDGGFGEDLRSYRDDSWRGRGASTASQTAWALLALHAAGETGPVAEGAVRFLVESQKDDGSWDEPWYTGTGFPGDFYLNYHLYRQVFPVSALGRMLAERGH
ncbi:MAG TPA: squalene--hopene cyclase [Gaiellaceae bacterium]|nr:squalene--hopene cyclase [Gaiellaceae bacterium]